MAAAASSSLSQRNRNSGTAGESKKIEGTEGRKEQETIGRTETTTTTTTSNGSNTSVDDTNKSTSTTTSSVGGPAMNKRSSSNPLSVSVSGILCAILFLLLGAITPPLLQQQNQNAIRVTILSAVGMMPDPILGPHGTSDSVKERLLVQTDATKEEVVASTTQSCSNKDRLKDFFYDEYVAGYNIICFDLDAKTDQNDELQQKLQVTYFAGGLNQSHSQELPYPMSWPSFRSILVQTLHLPSVLDTEHPKQPWAIFSTAGQYLINERAKEEEEGEFLISLLIEHSDNGIVLLFEGGRFLWPGVRIGYERSVPLYAVMDHETEEQRQSNRTVTLQTLSIFPLVLSVKGFLSLAECAHIQTLAEPTMEYSSVVLMDKDKGRDAADFRTSQSTFLEANDDIMLDIDYRTASLVRTPRNHQENVQVLRYGYGERYVAHTDYFDPALYAEDRHTMNMIQRGRRNRLATVLWYLSDVEEGGETVFPRFNRLREKSFHDCENGLRVEPEAGKVIIFYSLTADGRMDPYSLHGACPVKVGVKWAANKWVWNAPMYFVSE